MEETLNARFNHDGKKLLKTKKQRKISTDANNARNRDIYSITRATGMFSDANANDAIEEMQQQAYVEMDVSEQVHEKGELLTRKEYERLINAGATIPEPMKEFYDNLFKGTVNTSKYRK